MRLVPGLAMFLAAPLLLAAQDAGGPLPGKANHPEALAFSESAQPQPETAPDQSDADPALAALMDRIEGALRMPAGAQPVAGYTRYYAWADKARTKVTGVLVTGGRAERKWIGFDDLPLSLAPGCAVVSLVFDAARGTIDEVYCNGG
ncbi:hypothetical protein ACFQ1E_10130 [Sphingomonas canadensis]|uniref:Uncharacterized protein n=1 Tax=Sphingomonas canadensis TaxID=1219257 RepID=A0ABW3H5E3_9SPHN|nr:hypothetical protein [Sphingomonas canadensis]MCW3836523.1 hypothetical protein [Sphingomonas canadensis]